MGSLQEIFNYVAGSIGDLGAQAYGSIAGAYDDGVQSVNDMFGFTDQAISSL